MPARWWPLVSVSPQWYLRGVWHVYQFSGEDLATAKLLFRESIEKDPSLAQAHTSLAEVSSYELILGLTDDPEKHYRDAVDLAQTGVALENSNPYAHHVLGLE